MSYTFTVGHRLHEGVEGGLLTIYKNKKMLHVVNLQGSTRKELERRANKEKQIFLNSEKE